MAPDSHFVVGRAEKLPVADGAADLMTAAGSLNYVDLEKVFPEARRVLRTAGTLGVYDFSQGKRIADSPALEEWFGSFTTKYPAPPFSGRPLTPELLTPLAEGFRPTGSAWYEEALMLDHSFYVDYAMTETNVAPVFGGAAREVIFTGYIAYFSPL